MGSLLNGARDPVTKGMEKAKVLNVFFASVFIGKASLQELQPPETSGKVCSKEDLSLVDKDQVREHLNISILEAFKTQLNMVISNLLWLLLL